MPDMYDKLGDLLNDALESGKIPVEKQENTTINSDNNKDRETSNVNCDKSGLFSFNNSEKNDDKKSRIRIKIPENSKNASAEVIKMHNYAIKMHIPPVIQDALSTLDIVYPYSVLKIKTQYRKLLKIHHPDSKSTIQDSLNVNKNRHLTVDDVKSAYTLLADYFKFDK